MSGRWDDPRRVSLPFNGCPNPLDRTRLDGPTFVQGMIWRENDWLLLFFHLPATDVPLASKPPSPLYTPSWDDPDAPIEGAPPLPPCKAEGGGYSAARLVDKQPEAALCPGLWGPNLGCLLASTLGYPPGDVPPRWVMKNCPLHQASSVSLAPPTHPRWDDPAATATDAEPCFPLRSWMIQLAPGCSILRGASYARMSRWSRSVSGWPRCFKAA